MEFNFHIMALLTCHMLKDTNLENKNVMTNLECCREMKLLYYTTFKDLETCVKCIISTLSTVMGT